MKRLSAGTEGVSAQQEVARRCRGLGLPTWLVDAKGTLADRPEGAGALDRWMACDQMCERAVGLLESFRPGYEPTVAELLPGGWLIIVPMPRVEQRAGATLALAPGPELLCSPEFELWCRGVGEEPARARAEAGRVCAFTRAAAEALARSLRWMHEDLSWTEDDQASLLGFSRELMDAYEQIRLLYRVGRSMGTRTDPRIFVHKLCDELRSNSAFGWVAARLHSPDRTVLSLHGALIVSAADGRSPGERSGLWDLIEGRVAEGESAVLAWEGVPGSGGYDVLAHPIRRDGRMMGFLAAGDKGGIDPDVSSTDIQLLDAMADLLGVFISNAGLYEEQQALFLGTLRALTASIDAKDPYTCGHSERVAQLAGQLASALGLDSDQAERLRVGGLVHDVGKIGIPEAVLRKPGKLTAEEFDMIKQHPEIGYRILRDIRPMRDVLPGVLHHHERWDGRGYPRGLAGDAIPLAGRIIGLVDAFDAMSSTRSYRGAMPRERVLAEIRLGAGTQFDPQLVPAFLKLDLRAYDRLVARHTREHEQIRAA